MNALKKTLLPLLLACLLLVPMFALAADDDESGISGTQISGGFKDLPDQITAVQRPIAVDSDIHYIDIQVSLKYKIYEALNRNPFKYFTITPEFDDSIKDLFVFDKSNYTQYISDLVVVTDEEGNYIEDYFSFPFWVKEDAINGNYTMNFKVKFLNFYADVNQEQPEEATIPVHFRIENGKDAPKTSDGGSSDGTPEKNPSTAMLLLESYTLNPEDVVAGDEFDLTFVFRNTTSKTIYDIKATLSNELNTLLPANGSSTIYIEKIAADETAEATVRMRSTPNCGIEPAVLKVAYNYVQSKLAYEGSDSITLPVRQLPNLSLDTPYYPTEVYQGDAVNLMMNLFNKGKSTIYNVTVSLESDGLRAEETYFAGNMDSGASKSYDVMAYTMDGVSGPVTGNIVVTYEDDYGVETRKEVPISLNVIAMDYGMDEPVVDIPVDVEPVQTGMPLWGWIAIGGGVAVVALVIVLLVVKRAKRKKNEEMDDEMD